MRDLPMTRIFPALLLILVAASLTLSGCSPRPEAAAPQAATAEDGGAVDISALPPTVDAETVNALRGRDDVLILDVRENHEFAAGHIPEATLIPLGQLGNRLSELPADKTILAVCRSGNRSGQATELLRRQGFTVHNMQGGMIAWEQAGFDIAR